uniref:Calponin-homology (CH) domain-containing protein n=1 Tax=Megaselia scalaris TaxID=36166 RepID=T1GKX3_MEGSC
MTQRDGIIKFENERIKTLQEERLHIQKKTFTKWMNSFLIKAKMEVEDLFTDLADGIKLLKLLEIISGEKLGKPNNGRMRVHKIENVNKSLAFLHTKFSGHKLAMTPKWANWNYEFPTRNRSRNS